MTTYAYRGFSEAGRQQKGLIEARSVKDARAILARRGTLADAVAPADDRTSRFRYGGRGGFSGEDRAGLYHELGALQEAGISIEKCFDLLIDSPEMEAHRHVLAGIRDRIRDGGSLAAAMGVERAMITPLEGAILEVGERTGTLADVLQQLAATLDSEKTLRDRVRNAMIYPAVVVVVGVVLSVGLLGFGLPFVAGLLEDTRIELPLLTRFMLAAGGILRVAGVPLLLAAFLGWIWARRLSRETSAGAMTLDRLGYRIPIFGRGRTITANIRFATTLAALLRGGVPLVEGMPMAGRATGSAWVTGLVDRETDAVMHGESLSDAVRRIPPLATSLPGWIQAGEASGDLARLLEKAAMRCNRQWENYISRVLGVLEPMLILLVGAFVLTVTLAVLLPLLAISQSL